MFSFEKFLDRCCDKHIRGFLNVVILLLFFSSTNSTETSVCAPPPSIQHTCSQLIKAGLKLSIEQKRKYQQGEAEDLLDLDKQCKRLKRSECSESEDDKNNYGTGVSAFNFQNSKTKVLLEVISMNLLFCLKSCYKTLDFNIFFTICRKIVPKNMKKAFSKHTD